MFLLDIQQRIPAPQRFGIAFAGVLAATILIEVVQGPSAGVPFFAFYPVVLFTTYFFGPQCGIFALGASIFSAWFFLVPTAFSFEIESPLSEKRLLLRATVASVLAASAYVVRRNVLTLEVTRERDTEIARRALRTQELSSSESFANLDWLARFVDKAATDETNRAARPLLSELGMRIEILKSATLLPIDSNGRIDASALLRNLCDRARKWHPTLTVRFSPGSPVHIETWRALATATAILAAFHRIEQRGPASIDVVLALAPGNQVTLSLDWTQEAALPSAELVACDELVLLADRLGAASWPTRDEPPAAGCRWSFPVELPPDGSITHV